MPVNTIGPVASHKTLATATYSFTPQEPYAAVVQRITLTGVSASDTWVLSVNGKELARFVENTTGNQQLLSAPTSSYPKTNDLFTYLKDTMNIDLVYPVPQGATLTLASVGGATADVDVLYTEYNPTELVTSMLNHPNGTHMIVPVYGYLNAAVTAAGEYDFDTEVKPSWIPSFWKEAALVAGWRVKLLGLFLQGAGVNTFSGAADHQSVTDHLSLYRNGQQMFSRDSTDGLPMVGVASNAGSANTQYGTRLGVFHAFQNQLPWAWEYFDPPMPINTGDAYEWKIGFTGNFVGNPSYAGALQIALLDIVQTGVGQ